MPDTVEVRENGRRYLVRGESPFRVKARAHLEHHAVRAAAHHEAKLQRVAVKRARQKNNGWPADKSPV